MSRTRLLASKKSSPEQHFRMLLDHGARGDLPNGDGVTALELMARRRCRGFQRMAERLATR